MSKRPTSLSLSLSCRSRVLGTLATTPITEESLSMTGEKILHLTPRCPFNKGHPDKQMDALSRRLMHTSRLGVVRCTRCRQRQSVAWQASTGRRTLPLLRRLKWEEYISNEREQRTAVRRVD